VAEFHDVAQVALKVGGNVLHFDLVRVSGVNQSATTTTSKRLANPVDHQRPGADLEQDGALDFVRLMPRYEVERNPWFLENSIYDKGD
jgi:hypothetical protein